MRDGSAELDAIIARIRKIPGMARRVAPAVAAAVRDELERQIAAGTAPDGMPWQPRKADGGKPLADAAKALAVVPLGTRVYCAVRGYIARHDLGRARGGVVRKILPRKGIPAALERVIRRALTEDFDAEIRGA